MEEEAILKENKLGVKYFFFIFPSSTASASQEKYFFSPAYTSSFFPMASDAKNFRVVTSDGDIISLPPELLNASDTFTNLISDITTTDKNDENIPIPITTKRVLSIIDWAVHEASLGDGDIKTVCVRRPPNSPEDPIYEPSPWDAEYANSMMADGPVDLESMITDVKFFGSQRLQDLLMFALAKKYIYAKSPQQLRESYNIPSSPDDEDEHFTSEDEEFTDDDSDDSDDDVDDADD